MKPKFLHSFAAQLFICATMILNLQATETLTDTQVSQANNLASKKYGVLLSVPDFLVRNVNDDQAVADAGYEQWDRDHVPSLNEQDLKEVTLTAKAGPNGGVLTLKIVGGKEEKITCPVSGHTDTIYWVDKLKETRFPIAGEPPQPDHSLMTWTLDANELFNEVFYIEGVENSATQNDIQFVATLVTDSVPQSVPKETTIYEVDLDIDSDNNQQLEAASRSLVEDRIENSKGPIGSWSRRPGKILMVNDGFGDGVPDWADGFGADPGNSSSDVLGDPIKFVPLTIERKAPYTDQCTVKFIYSASDPSGVIPTSGYGFEDYQVIFTKPSGKIRIWKKNNNGTKRDKRSIKEGGDFVPTDVELNWSSLGSSDCITLYVEAVDASSDLADIFIKSVISQNGASVTDDVNITAIKITCEPISGNLSDNKIINPSGVVSGSTAKFEVRVEPEDMPNSAIVWDSDVMGVFGNTTNNGSNRQVDFTAGITADTYGKLWVEIEGNYYDRPEIPLKVFNRSITVKVYMFVLGDGDNNYAFDIQKNDELKSEIQKYYNQAGINFEFQSLEILDYGKYKDYYDLDGLLDGKMEAMDLVDHTSSAVGVEVYLVNSYEAAAGENISGAFGYGTEGIVIATNLAPTTAELANTIAHEIGHSCGLDDIYDSNGVIFYKAKKTWAQNDWPVAAGFNSDPSYYARDVPGGDYATLQHQLISKLLMYGSGSPSPSNVSDITVGRIYGLNGDDFFPNLDQVETGLIDINRYPIHD